MLAALLLLLGSASSARAQAFCSATSPPPGPCVISASRTVSGALAVSARGLVIGPAVIVTVTGTALSVLADSITMEAGAKIVAPGVSPTAATIDIVTSGTVWLKAGSSIVTSVDPTDGGGVNVTADGDITIDGQINSGGGKFGDGGPIALVSNHGSVHLTGTTPIVGTGGQFGTGGRLSADAPLGSIDVAGTLDLTGGDGGFIDLDAANLLTSTAPTGKMDVSADTAGSDAGIISLHGGNGMTLAGPIIGRSSGSADDGAGVGAVVIVLSEGDIAITGLVDVTGPGPDGEAGNLTVRGVGITLTGEIVAAGKGDDGCGGDILVRSTGPVAIGPILGGNHVVDISGASCGGGSIDVGSDGTITVRAEVNGDGNKFGGGATMKLRGQEVDVFANMHANGLAGAGDGGSITLHGCALNVSATGQVFSQGAHGKNFLLSNGQMVVSGPVTTGGKTCTVGNDIGKSCLNDSKCTPPSPPATIPPIGLCAETGINTIQWKSFPPTITGPVTPTTTPQQLLDLGPCVGPELPPTTTTTTSTSTTTSTTGTGPTTTSSSITTSTSTSSSITTTTRTTTSSRTTSTSSSTSTSTSTTSTTSTSIPQCTVAAACDDGDFCTDDGCRSNVCVHTPLDGVRAVSCRVDTLDAQLQATSPSDVGGSSALTKLLNKVTAMHRTIDAAGEPGTKKAKRKFKAAGNQLKGFIGTVTRGQKKHKITDPVATSLLTIAGQAKDRLLPLQK